MLDREVGTYADPDKVRPIHFRGSHFSSRGPLNTVPSPQHRPAFVQAGASPRGRAFAARMLTELAWWAHTLRAAREEGLPTDHVPVGVPTG